MKCYRCGEDLSKDEDPKSVDLGYDLHVWICADCRRIVLRDAMNRLFVERVKAKLEVNE